MALVGAQGEARRAMIEYTENSRTLSLTGEELGLASVPFSAIGLVVDIPSRQNHPGDNCCL